jgi:hypothetical protein
MAKLVEARATYVVMSLKRLDQDQDLSAIDRSSTTTCLHFQTTGQLSLGRATAASPQSQTNGSVV